MLHYVQVPFTTDSSGDATVYSDRIFGRLHSIFYDYGDAATGADIAITGGDSGQALLTITNAGTADITWMPRSPLHSTVGVASLYAAAGEPVEDLLYVFYEQIKIVVSSGGDAKSGALWIAVLPPS